jgi:hypothetical protein
VRKNHKGVHCVILNEVKNLETLRSLSLPQNDIFHRLKRKEKLIMNFSKNKKLLSAAVICLSLISLSQPCWAQAYKIEKDVLNGGIKEISSDAYSAWSSVGQAVTGNMEGGEYILMGGFWSAFTYFVSGDANNDEMVNSADVVYLINYLYIDGPPPVALPSGDVNCDGKIDASDVVYLINYLFIHGPAPKMCDP